MNQRRHDIDALRVFAFALLILYHCAMLYVADWDFHLKSAYQGEWLQWPMIALNRWRMPLLFMISGIALGLARVEGRRLSFALARTWRLLLPLLFGMFVVVAFQAYCEGRANGHVAPGVWAFMARYWQVRPWPAGSFSGWGHGNSRSGQGAYAAANAVLDDFPARMPYPAMNARLVSKKSRRPSAGNSSSIIKSWYLDLLLSAPSSLSVRRRPIWFRMRRTRGLVRLMSEGGMTR